MKKIGHPKRDSQQERDMEPLETAGSLRPAKTSKVHHFPAVYNTWTGEVQRKSH
jgi:hypothetical protein